MCVKVSYHLVGPPRIHKSFPSCLVEAAHVWVAIFNRDARVVASARFKFMTCRAQRLQIAMRILTKAAAGDVVIQLQISHLVSAKFTHPTASMQDRLPFQKSRSLSCIDRVERIEY